MPGSTLPKITGKHRLHEGLQEKRHELSAGDNGIAPQDGQERLGGKHLAKMSPGKRDEHFFKARLLHAEIAHLGPSRKNRLSDRSD